MRRLLPSSRSLLAFGLGTPLGLTTLGLTTLGLTTLGLTTLGLTTLGCGKAAAPRDAGAARVEFEPEARPAPRERVARRVHPAISVENVERRLTPFIESIGAGFGPGSRPTGFVAVSAGGEVIYERGFGQADFGAEAPNTDETAFRIGALTAQFTAAAVLRLVQAKKLSLDDPISRFIPDYPGAGAAISVHQLLSHTSGLPNYLSSRAVAERRDEAFTPQELLALFWSEPLEFEPGSDFGYSDSDYAVLGVIIERVTGKPYAAHMREAIFERFDLDDTSAGPFEGDSARGYSASTSGGLEPSASFHDSILYAAAGVRSTAEDLLSWHDRLQDGDVLDAEREALLSRVVKNHYSYGWFVREQQGHTVLRHSGGLPGFVSDFVRAPELDLAITVLLNNSSLDAAAIADAAFDTALGEPLEPRPRQTSVPLDPTLPPRITGTYRLSEAAAQRLEQQKIPKRAMLAMRSVRVYQEDDQLYFKPMGQAAVRMVPTGRGTFVLVGGKAKIEVLLDPGDAPATTLLLEQGPLRAEFTRRARQHGKADLDAEELGESEEEGDREPTAED